MNLINSDIAEITSFPGTHLLDPTAQVDVKYEEIFLVFFILFLWAVVLRIFFQRWGKIRGLLPYQPVYSREMVERIDQIDKIVRSNRPSLSFQPLDCYCNYNYKVRTASSSCPGHQIESGEWTLI